MANNERWNFPFNVHYQAINQRSNKYWLMVLLHFLSI